ncbi:hypothetical protein IMCC26256_111955 [Actinobacteria bacterium IMCC26256]|uniref:Unannotated protein n=1 Tax=freshwater metagenome TaxID=449393 RepID=A0A6J7KCY2_9ZZZZ|nr:hypothetical protein IMCC26256_111955 [Actinobacteria bacterium IMCC26256]
MQGESRLALLLSLGFYAMSRPIRFEENQFVGDKRSQIVYDLDLPSLDKEIIDELMESEKFICFGPDTLNEARNRGYKPHKSIRESQDAENA